MRKRKEYEQPTAEVVELKLQQILCTSPGDNEVVTPIDDPEIL